MSILSWFKRKPAASRPVIADEVRQRYPRGVTAPFTVVGVASVNGRDIADTLAFVIHEACGWNVATIDVDYFVKTGVGSMLAIGPGGEDPVIGARFEDVVDTVRCCLDEQYPGIWLRCLDSAQSRLPHHILVVHGITREDEAEWVRARAGKIAGDGTIGGLGVDIPVGLDANNTYIAAATEILDALTTK